MAEDFVGVRVRSWRLKRGLSQRTLAGLAGMTQGYVWKAARYDHLSLVMPDLVADLHALSISGEEPSQRAALRLLVETTHCLTSTLRHLNAGDLAMIAADLGHDAAARLDEPVWLGLADYVRLVTLPAESKPLTRRLAIRAAERLSAETPSGEGLQVAGMLHLSAAFSAASAEDAGGTETHLAEARQLAARTGEGTFATMQFGPTNVSFWETSIAVATGEGGRVREIGRRVTPDRIDSDTRQAAYFIDYGRGLAQTRRNDAEAIASFIRAERIAPQRTRRSPAARETVGTMLRRARATAGGNHLRELASRIGVA